mgnify:CR=1 FL=1
MKENIDHLSRVDWFHVGQVWVTSRGRFWRVVQSCGIGTVLLRASIHGTGRKMYRQWDDIGRGWHLAADHEIGHIHADYADIIKPEAQQ